MTELDRWAVASLTLISLGLVAAAVVTGDRSFLGYLGGTSALAVAYFWLGRG